MKVVLPVLVLAAGIGAFLWAWKAGKLAALGLTAASFPGGTGGTGTPGGGTGGTGGVTGNVVSLPDGGQYFRPPAPFMGH